MHLKVFDCSKSSIFNIPGRVNAFNIMKCLALNFAQSFKDESYQLRCRKAQPRGVFSAVISSWSQPWVAASTYCLCLHLLPQLASCAAFYHELHAGFLLLCSDDIIFYKATRQGTGKYYLKYTLEDALGSSVRDKLLLLNLQRFNTFQGSECVSRLSQGLGGVSKLRKDKKKMFT